MNDEVATMFREAAMRQYAFRITEIVANTLGESLYKDKRMKLRKRAVHVSTRGAMLRPDRTTTFRLLSGGTAELSVNGNVEKESFSIQLVIPPAQFGARWISDAFLDVSAILESIPFVFSVQTSTPGEEEAA